MQTTQYVRTRSVLCYSACLLMSLCLLGCSDEKAATQSSGGKAKTGSRDKANPLVKVTIDEVLKLDLPKQARAKFEQLKKDGRKQFVMKEVDAIIAQSSIMNFKLMNVASRRARKPIRQPSLSVLNYPIEFRYPEQPINAWKYIQGQADYMRIGLEHFKTKEFYKFGESDQKSVLAFMDDALAGAEYEFDIEKCQSVLAEGERLDSKYSAQLSTEPMFNFCLALAESRGQKLPTAHRRMDNVIIGFALNDYPTRMAILAFRYVDQWRTNYKTKNGYAFYVAAIKHWISQDFRARGIEERYAMEDIKLFLVLAFLNTDLSALDEFASIVESSSTIPPWFKAMALGAYQAKTFDPARGRFAREALPTKSPEELKAHANAAHNRFEDALKINPRFPESAVELMKLARVGHSDKEEEFWFKRAIEHEIDFMGAYRIRLVGMMPRWGGSIKEMCNFAIELAQQKQFDTGVPYVLPVCIFMIRNFRVMDSDRWHRELLDQPYLLDETIKALDGMIQHNKNFVFDRKRRDPNFLPTLRALFLMRAGKADLAERAYREMDGQHSGEALEVFGVGAGSLQALMAGASAFSAEYQQEARELRNMMDVSVDERINNFEKIKQLVDNISFSEESGGLYFERSLQQVTLEKAFRDGEKVSVRFDPKMNLWSLRENRQLKYVSETKAVYDNRIGNQSNQLHFHGQFPGPRIIEATLTFPKDDSEIFDGFAPGFLTGMSDRHVHMVGFSSSLERANPSSNHDIRIGYMRTGLSRYNSPPSSIMFPLRDGRCRIKIKTDRGFIEVYVDGQYVARTSTNFSKLTSGFAIQHNRGSEGRGWVEVSDITVEKWKNPPPRGGSRKQLLDYYQKQYDAVPDDPWNMFWLGHAKHSLDDFEGALPLYKKASKAGISNHFVGYYLGDVCDRLGRREEALSWYLESAVNLKGGGENEMVHVASSRVSFGQPSKWSAFRANWIVRTTELETVSEAEPRIFALSLNHSHPRWLYDLMRQIYEAEGSIPSKLAEYILRRLGDIKKEAPEEFRDDVAEITAAIVANGSYDAGLKKQPLYLKTDKIPFFDRYEPPR